MTELEKLRICTVVVAVYRARRDWLKECLHSIRLQRRIPGWVVGLQVGVDGCEASSELLQELGVSHWFSAENVGPYVIRNSLLELTPWDTMAVFDADDVMHRDYLKTLVPLAGRYGVAGAARRTIDEHVPGRQLLRRSVYGSGVAVVSREVWKAAGGFKAWRNGADWDFSKRVDALGFMRRAWPHVLYDRRRHSSSLSISSGKAGRDAAVARAAAELEQGILRVDPVTVPLERR